MRYPGKGSPWADYLHFRARLWAAWEAEGKTPEQITRDMQVDPGQVRLVLAETRDDHVDAAAAAGAVDKFFRQGILALKPDPHVLDKRGRIKRHKFEPPHDAPAPGPCWYCLRPEKAKVHR